MKTHDRALPLAIKVLPAHLFLPVFLLAGVGLAGTGDSGAHAQGDYVVVSDNLLWNGSFEDMDESSPAGWEERTFSGAAEFEVAIGEGLDQGNAVMIRSREGADAAWLTRADLVEGRTYRLSGWVRTENVAAGKGRGAQLNVHDVPIAETRTPALTGTRDWTHVEVTFVANQTRSTRINALLGGWGESTGIAWFDDLSLVELGPAENDAPDEEE